MSRTPLKFAQTLAPLAALALALALPTARAADPVTSQPAPQTVPPGPAHKGAAHFKQLDTNGDGSLSREEAQAAPGLSKQFDTLDADKNGQITPKEMMAQAKSKAGEAFAKLDADSSGSISRTEAAGAPRLAARFDELDADKDGQLSPEELRAMKRR